MKSPKKLWGGRFKKTIDSEFEKFSESFSLDKRLALYDLIIDKAQVHQLARMRLITAKDKTKFIKAIDALLGKVRSGDDFLDPASEDVHSAVQSALSQSIGSLANTLHTGRSRNDLVAQSSRLYVKDHSLRIEKSIVELQRSILAQAKKHQESYIAGMTHMQNAQVVSLSHILLSYVEMLDRSRKLLVSSQEASDVLVLGSGALAGSTFDFDQRAMAKSLGLSRITRNSYDVSGDRDFIVSFLFACANLSTHLSRMAEDIMIWQLRSVDIIDLDEAFCTGSSMMPQKKNADFVELTRGSAGKLYANLNSLMITLKGLPTSYNRDLQCDKSVLFSSAESALALLSMWTRLWQGIEFKKSSMAKTLVDELLYATDLADYLSGKGLAFSRAHELVGQIIQFSETNRVSLSKIGLDIYQNFSPLFSVDLYEIFTPESSVSMKRTQGSTNPKFVARQILHWKKILK